MPTSKHTAPSKSPSLPPAKKKKHGPPPPEAHPSEKPGKKHAKKHGKGHEEKPESKSSAKHLRRAFEHLGRVEALQTLTSSDDLATLVHLAQQTISTGQARSAADLLRAAEHLSFASAAAAQASVPDLSPDLEEAIRREFRKLLEHADDHDLPKESTPGTILRQTLDQARSAFESQNFRQALEFARAAEALASLDPASLDGEQVGKPKLPSPRKHAPKA